MSSLAIRHELTRIHRHRRRQRWARRLWRELLSLRPRGVRAWLGKELLYP